ncbi:unnamed protein product [Coregonus sp. 'balchen']|nr:unnamed protein product [Coregonus sp. 'balchen']
MTGHMIAEIRRGAPCVVLASCFEPQRACVRSGVEVSNMSLEDPFFVVKGSLYERWEELLEDGTQVSKDELDWSTNELRNCLRAIDWDLEDLSETISIVESNPGKFRLVENELQERRDFVERTRQAVQALLGASEQDRSDGLEPHLVSANSRYIQDQQEQQQLIMEDQDEQLELVTGSIRVLKDIMLGEFGEEMDQTGSRMDSVLKKMEKVSHMTSSRRQWCAIGVLVVIMIVVLILFFTL